MACTAAEHKMEELYAAIEKKIKASGYPREISGADVYDDICDQIEGKENMISAIRSREKRTEAIFFCPSLRMM